MQSLAGCGPPPSFTGSLPGEIGRRETHVRRWTSEPRRQDGLKPCQPGLGSGSLVSARRLLNPSGATRR
jgi:hypothetical protein